MDNIIRLSEQKLEAERSFKRKLEMFKQKVSTNRENLSLFGAAHRPQETPLSESYLNNIAEQDDINHIIEDPELPDNHS